AADGTRRCPEAETLDLTERCRQPGFGDVGDQQVLPNRQPDRAGTEVLGDIRKSSQLGRRQPPGRQNDAGIKETGLGLRPDPDVAVLIDGSALLTDVERKKPPRERQMTRRFGKAFFDSPTLD